MALEKILKKFLKKLNFNRKMGHHQSYFLCCFYKDEALFGLVLQILNKMNFHYMVE